MKVCKGAFGFIGCINSSFNTIVIQLLVGISPVPSAGWDLTRPVGISPVRLGSRHIAPYPPPTSLPWGSGSGGGGKDMSGYVSGWAGGWLELGESPGAAPPICSLRYRVRTLLSQPS